MVQIGSGNPFSMKNTPRTLGVKGTLNYEINQG
jgi:hypothetical protein